MFEETRYNPSDSLKTIHNSYDVILLNCNFDINQIYNSNHIPQKYQYLIEEIVKKELDKCFKLLRKGGLLFVYNIPKYLIFYGNSLNKIKNENSKMLFKYWIALDINDSKRMKTLKNSHIGLLMYLKTTNAKSTSPFHLNTKEIRVPYENCEHCRKNLKDWGGKKHLMNPLGACLSDVWKDLPKHTLKNNLIPDAVKERILNLTFKKDSDFKALNIVEEVNFFEQILQNKLIKVENSKKYPIQEFTLEKNMVIEEDCVDFLIRINQQHPEGFIDLFFTDPPYNLEKNYSKYEDDLKDSEYLKWCKTWLDLGIKALKPGGALLLLNLPKWNIYFGQFLMERMDFQHWIAWDSMSTPAGKLMPAHYSILYFTKPGSPITFNYESRTYEDLLSPIDSNIYCLRESCRKERKSKNNDKKLPLTDIWWDIHRIKHKKDRDYHPCQLPLKLLKRIINMTTKEGDLVYDPLGGTGTTAIVAQMLGREYLMNEIDKKYVEIAKSNLDNIRTSNSKKFLYRESIKRENNKIPKKQIEIEYIKLCRIHSKILSKEELRNIDSFLLNRIQKNYPSFNYLKKITKRVIEMNGSVEPEKEQFKKLTDFI